jgi:ribosome-binding factor A
MIEKQKQNPFRLQKQETEIINLLNRILLKDITNPKDCLITINRLKLYADMSHAIVYFTVLPDHKLGTAKRFFKEKKKSFQFFFNKYHSIRRTPKLFFRYDSDEAENRALDSLIDDAMSTLDKK